VCLLNCSQAVLNSPFIPVLPNNAGKYLMLSFLDNTMQWIELLLSPKRPAKNTLNNLVLLKWNRKYNENWKLLPVFMFTQYLIKLRCTRGRVEHVFLRPTDNVYQKNLIKLKFHTRFQDFVDFGIYLMI